MPEMNPDTPFFSRREALGRAVAGVLGLAALTAGEMPAATIEPEFVPENEYPFFGSELPDEF